MKIFLKRFVKILVRISLWFLGISILSVILFRFIPLPFTPLMMIRCVGQKMNGKEMKMSKEWVSLKEISPAMPMAAIAAEDQKFEDHFGFDVEAIRKAEKYNENHKGKKNKRSEHDQPANCKKCFSVAKQVVVTQRL